MPGITPATAPHALDGETTSGIVVDDHLLLRILLDDEPAELWVRDGRVATTGFWYHRLCRALADTTVTGVMSRSLGDVDPHVAAGVVRAVTELPDTIDLVSLRTLAWPMAQLLSTGARLNLMSLEALAAAEHLDAAICLAAADHDPLVQEAAEQRGVPARSIPP